MDGREPRGIGWLPAANHLWISYLQLPGRPPGDCARGLFAAALERSASKRSAKNPPGAGKIEEYLSALHLQDLAPLAPVPKAAPMRGIISSQRFSRLNAFWASAILRCPPDSPAACELADSLFRGSLWARRRRQPPLSVPLFSRAKPRQDWLRAVLAQRHIDAHPREPSLHRSRRRGRPRRAASAQLAAPRHISRAPVRSLSGSASNELRNPITTAPWKSLSVFSTRATKSA